MWKNKKHIFVLFFATWLVFTGCAKIMPLTGGDEDRTPPKFRSAKPDTFSLNFRGKTITIKFDEYINLVDPTREVIISPPVEPAPEFTAIGQAIRIKFKDSLRPNVTYVINFGNSIEDITEANKFTGFTFVFSTGPTLDSGQVSGNIMDAFTGKPAEDYKVMLYNTDVTDSFPYKEKPFYLAYTDKGGVFKFGNLKKGNYKIFALLEDNNNFLFDRSGEKIAFTPITVSTDDSTLVKMVSFAEEGGAIKFNKAKSISAVRTDFYFSGDAEKVKISPYKGFKDSTYLKYEFNKTNDTVTLWHNAIEVDTAGFIIVGENSRDTSILKINKATVAQSVGKGRQAAKAFSGLGITLDAAGNTKFDLYSLPTITTSEPAKGIDTSRIKLYSDSVSLPFSLLPDSVSPRKYRLEFARASNKNYVLICDSAAFIGLSGKASLKNTFSFGFREQVEYASVRVNYEDSIIKFPKIWQLLKDDKVIRENFAPANRNDVEFNRLEPGSYTLRVIFDENGNKRWDTGKFIVSRQPERVKYLSETIELKAGWDSEITWKQQKSRKQK